MKVIFALMVFTLVLVPVGSSQKVDISDIKWVKYSDEDNIQVFEATEPHSSGLLPIKVHTVLNHPITKVITVMTDASRKTEWVPRLDISKTVEQVGFGDFIDYHSFDAPWPFEDRDFLVRIKTEYDLKKKEVHAEIYSVQHPKMPEVKGFVRGHTYSGNTFLKSIENDTKTYVEVAFFNDYKGDIPKWLINMVQLTWPRTFIAQLRTQLEKGSVKDKFKTLEVVKKYLEEKKRKAKNGKGGRKTAGSKGEYNL